MERTMISCSKEDGDDLPMDILYEIFIRLPLKPVFKFRCVSKLWNSLLSNSTLVSEVFSITAAPSPWTIVYDRGDFFARNPQVFQTYSLNIHNNLINEDHNGFSFQFLIDNAETFWNNIMSEVESESSNCEESERWDYSQVPIPRVELFSSCGNGLVLYKLCQRPKANLCTHPWDQLPFNVCNPLTKQCVSLPPRPEKSSIHCNFVGLVSETSTTSNYKVVVLGGTSCTTTLLQIFSSDTGEWTTYGPYEVDSAGPVRPSYRSKSNMVVSNGVVYWNEFLDSTSDDSDNYSEDYMVVRAFNLENKNIPKYTLRSIYLPGDIKPDSRVFFGVSEGSVYYVNISFPETFSQGFLSVWLLKEDFSNRGWVWKPVHISIKMKYHSIFNDCRFFCYLHPEDRNVIIFLETPRFPCLAYNVNDLTYDVLCASPIPPSMVDNSHYFLPPLLVTPKPTRIPLLSPLGDID